MAMEPRRNSDAGRARKNLAGRLATPLAALAMLLAGLVLLAWPAPQEDVGWFAYTPLPARPVLPQGLVFMGAGAWAGVALTGAGLLVLAFWTGYRAGRQAGERPAGNRQAGDRGGDSR
jgi:heme/copper-type cytochrome/quinol oxidase subunit 1